MINKKVTINNDTDTATCQLGIPNGILIIIATGEVKGIIESQNVKLLSGASNIIGAHTMTMIIGIVSIVIN